MQIIYKPEHSHNDELWLEYGKMCGDGSHDMFWYNEGEPEWSYFLRSLWSMRNTPNMYFLIRCYGVSVYLRGFEK